MRILIAGAGVAGLTLAALLRQRGFRPTVVEKRDSIAGGGYVLGLWPLGSRILKGLGLFPAFEEISVPLKRYSIADGRGRVMQTYPIELIGNTYGLIRMVQRGDLIQLLARAAGDLVRTGAGIANVRQDDSGVAVTFTDGASDSFDLLCACDGVHSRLRSQIFGALPADPVGWRGWAWWIDPALARNDTMTEYWQAGEWFCAVYPARNVLCAFAGVSVQDGVTPEIDDLRGRLTGLRSVAPGALECLGASENVFSDAFYSVSLKEWQRGRTVLVGDSASAFFPFGGLGIGASMAMEASAVLADELSRTDARFVPAALSFYEKRRRPRAAVFENASRSVMALMLRKPQTDPGSEAILQHQRQMFSGFKRLLEEPI